jgi:CDP-glycerol glycerophosphotransferase (TagB/SpsB family)
MLLRDLPSRDDTRAQLAVPRDAHLVLYTSNGFARDMISTVLDGIQSAPSPDLYWIIKLHPREKTRLLWERAIRERQLATTKVLEGEFDFYALLNACDIHVSFASTTLIEAAILGKPNLGLDVPHLVDPGGYADARAFLPVIPERLGITVQELIEHPERRSQLLNVQSAFAHDWCVHDGRSVSRIVRFLESIADEDSD